MCEKTRPTVSDYVIAVIMVVGAFAVMGALAAEVAGDKYIEVKQEQKVLLRTPLDVSRRRILTVAPGDFTMRIKVDEKGVRILPMAKHECPNGICSKLGHISKPGEALFCVPNRVSVSIIGNTRAEDKLDAVTR